MKPQKKASGVAWEQGQEDRWLRLAVALHKKKSPSFSRSLCIFFDSCCSLFNDFEPFDPCEAPVSQTGDSELATPEPAAERPPKKLFESLNCTQRPALGSSCEACSSFCLRRPARGESNKEILLQQHQDQSRKKEQGQVPDPAQDPYAAARSGLSTGMLSEHPSGQYCSSL